MTCTGGALYQWLFTPKWLTDRDCLMFPQKSKQHANERGQATVEPADLSPQLGLLWLNSDAWGTDWAIIPPSHKDSWISQSLSQSGDAENKLTLSGLPRQVYWVWYAWYEQKLGSSQAGNRPSVPHAVIIHARLGRSLNHLQLAPCPKHREQLPLIQQ